MPRVRSARAQAVDPSEQPSITRDFRLGVLPQAALIEGAPPVDVCELAGSAKMSGTTVGDTALELKRGGQIALALPEFGDRAVPSYTFTLDLRAELPDDSAARATPNEIHMPLLSGLISLAANGELIAAAPVALEASSPPSAAATNAAPPLELARVQSLRWHRLVLSVAAERAPGRVSVYIDGELAADWRLTSDLLHEWRYEPSAGPVVLRSGRRDVPMGLRVFDALPFALDATAVLKREAYMKVFIEGRDDQSLELSLKALSKLVLFPSLAKQVTLPRAAEGC